MLPLSAALAGKGRMGMAMAELIVRNPVAELNNLPTPRASRVPSLQGINLGLWWNKKIGGEVALEWLGEAFSAEFGTELAHYYDSFPAHPGMTEKAAKGSQA